MSDDSKPAVSPSQPEFDAWMRVRILERFGSIRHDAIFVGGSDPNDLMHIIFRSRGSRFSVVINARVERPPALRGRNIGSQYIKSQMPKPLLGSSSARFTCAVTAVVCVWRVRCRFGRRIQVVHGPGRGSSTGVSLAGHPRKGVNFVWERFGRKWNR
jgi:hypothetical protein